MRGPKFLKFVLKFCVIISFSFTAQAGISPQGVEVGFLAAYDAYLKDDAVVCARELESIKDDLDVLPEKTQNRARLYQAYCNYKLNAKSYAAVLVNDVSPAGFDAADKKMYNRLTSTLLPEINKLWHSKNWLFPYFGISVFRPRRVESSATVYGLHGGSSYLGWLLGAGVEFYKLKPVDGFSSYSEIFANVSLGRRVKESGTVRIFYTNINASHDAKLSGNIYGLGGSYAPGMNTLLNLDVSYSKYPTTALGRLTATGATLSLQQDLLKEDGYIFNVLLGSETIFTRSDASLDTGTGFNLAEHYQRWFMGLGYDVNAFQFTINGWRGNETLGVRNQGTMIFNGLKNYKSGYGASAAWTFVPDWTLKLTFSDESYNVSTQKISDLTFIGGLLVKF